MDHDTEQEQTNIEIERPNLDDLTPWLNDYVKKPLPSFENVKNEDGSLLSPDEQIATTKDFLSTQAENYRQERQGMENHRSGVALSDEEIQDILIKLVRNLQ